VASTESIANLALGALLLERRITNLETEKGNEATVLRTHFQTALKSALADMDLDSTSGYAVLEKVLTFPDNGWEYAYKYPENCAFLRRLLSGVDKDNRSTFIPKKVRVFNGQQVIICNQDAATAEIVMSDVPLNTLSASAEMAIAYRLAALSAPLITGKGAKTLMEQIDNKYKMAKSEAQEQDRNENFQFTDPEIDSEWVEFRTS